MASYVWKKGKNSLYYHSLLILVSQPPATDSFRRKSANPACHLWLGPVSSHAGRSSWSSVRKPFALAQKLSAKRWSGRSAFLQRLVIAGGLAYALGMKPYFPARGEKLHSQPSTVCLWRRNEKRIQRKCRLSNDCRISYLVAEVGVDVVASAHREVVGGLSLEIAHLSRNTFGCMFIFKLRDRKCQGCITSGGARGEIPIASKSPPIILVPTQVCFCSELVLFPSVRPCSSRHAICFHSL